MQHHAVRKLLQAAEGLRKFGLNSRQILDKNLMQTGLAENRSLCPVCGQVGARTFIQTRMKIAVHCDLTGLSQLCEEE